MGEKTKHPWWWLVVAVVMFAVGFGLTPCLSDAVTPMDDLYKEGQVSDPATTAYPGRAPGVAYEADAGDVGGD